MRAGRLEQAIESERQVVMCEEDYDRIFTAGERFAPKGGVYHWDMERRSLQVPDLGLVGGWANVVSLKYLPGGSIQP